MFVRMWLTCRCTRMPINSHARLTLFFTAINVVSGICAILRAISSTVPSRSSRGTTLLSRPHSRASVRGQRRRQQQPVHGAVPVHQQPRLDHGVPAGLAEALRKRHLEVRVLGGDAEVGQQPEIDSAAHAVAVNLGDRRLRELPQIQRRPQEQVGGALVQVLERVAEIRIGVFVGAPAGHVPAAEALAVGLEDDDLDLLVAVGFVQAGVDFVDQVASLVLALSARFRMIRAIGGSRS